MMVAVTVGLILLAGIIQLFVSNKQAYRIQEGTSVLNENARYALTQIEHDLRMADHWGGVEEDLVTVDGGVSALATDCAPESPLVSAIGIRGFDGNATASPLPSCIPVADYVKGTDMVVVRYAGPGQPATGCASTWKSYPGRVPTDCLKNPRIYVRAAMGRRAVIVDNSDVASLPADIYDGANKDPDPIANYEYNVVVYFVRPCASQDRGTANLCDGADDTTPTLARLVLGENNLVVQEDIIAGVEQMQISYGVDVNNDFTADIYQDAADVTANDSWAKVVNARVSLLIRNSERDVSYSDTTTYRLYGGPTGAGVSYTVPAADRNFHRKLFNFTVQIRNFTRA